MAAPKRHGLQKSQRIGSSRSFTRALRRGGHAADDTLVVFALRRTAVPETIRPTSRLGVTIPKKTGGAVVRNRWKRWIREAYRVHQHALPDGFDFVVRPRKDAVGSWDKIQRSLPKLAQKAVRRASRANNSGGG